MLVRLTTFVSKSNNEDVKNVLRVLNESCVLDYTALGLLEALAERLGPNKPFTVHCDGDYQTTFSSSEYLEYAAREGESASEDCDEWLIKILGPEPHKVVFNNCYGLFALSMEAEIWLRNHGMSEEEIADLWSNRHHPLLVRCVEVLGDRASGDFAKLDIAEIYSNKYRITDEDGWETVEVPDKLNWVII